MFGDTFWYAVIITALLELVLHWAPWPRALPRVLSYALGVAVILLGAGMWLQGIGRGDEFPGLLAIAGAAGLATVLGYSIDTVRNLIVRAKVHHVRDGE